MNYRHAFHAGNFADLLKHALLIEAVAALTRDSRPLSIIDTHAGAGLYDLSGDESVRTGEWMVTRLAGLGGIDDVVDAFVTHLQSHVHIHGRSFVWPPRLPRPPSGRTDRLRLSAEVRVARSR